MTETAKDVATSILSKGNPALEKAVPTISRDASLVSIMSAEAASGLRTPPEALDYNGAPILPKTHIASDVDARDINTPDDWVARHPDLVRLTGKHPFNCEPPLSALVDNGFITPPSLHFVRNHGYVPKCEWDSHKVNIGGLVDNPMSLGMDEIVNMKSMTIPVTLVCAGNRRKENNMVKQTIGFSWGAAGNSTNFWTGVRLRDLLLAAKIDRTKAKHVCFVGAEDLPNGKYGTSIPISRAMDEYGDVMIAYYQNGVQLAPDHGYPVRVIIPGWIGGRMVKWLTSIEVTEEPSENYYHFFDNRIMPPHVDAEMAKAEGWWYKPEYLFNELNINSSMARPAQGEIIKLGSATKTYEMKGYAYSGGGRRVTRVEVSVDGGKSWRLCDVTYPEAEHSDAPKYGRHWCWVFWTYTINTFEFLQAATSSKEVCVRAWDESNNVQPANITWNLMGMGNNCHFRTRILPEKIDGEFCLRFEHPTVAGPTEGGWMKPPAKPVVKVEEKKVEKDANAKTFTMDEIMKHTTDDDTWIVVRDRVYDCTDYLKDHPGGGASIVMNAGTDTTEEFDAIHSQKAQKMLEDWYIGDVAQDSKPAAVTATTGTGEIGEVALDPKKWMDFKMIEREELSRDSRRLRFGLHSPTQKLGLPVGHHFLIRGRVNGKLVIRAYTPTSSNDDLGMFELVIKVYFANEHPKFPEGGKLSQYLESLAIGDDLSIRGPIGHYEYLGNGKLHVNGEWLTKSKLGFICGGTGITPAYQIIKAVCSDAKDMTEVSLIYANKTEEDILLRKELDEFVAGNPRVKVHYTLDSPPEGWQFGTGFVCEEMVRKNLPAAGPDSFVGLCGPPPMIEFACVPNLEKVGYKEEGYVAF